MEAETCFLCADSRLPPSRGIRDRTDRAERYHIARQHVGQQEAHSMVIPTTRKIRNPTKNIVVALVDSRSSCASRSSSAVTR